MNDKANATSIEVSAVRGMRSVRFVKTFRTQAAYEKWLAKNEGDVQVLSYREHRGDEAGAARAASDDRSTATVLIVRHDLSTETAKFDSLDAAYLWLHARANDADLQALGIKTIFVRYAYRATSRLSSGRLLETGHVETLEYGLDEARNLARDRGLLLCSDQV